MSSFIRRCALSFPVDYGDLEQLDRLAQAAGLNRAGMARQVLKAGLDAAVHAAKAASAAAGEEVGHG